MDKSLIVIYEYRKNRKIAKKQKKIIFGKRLAKQKK